MLAVLADGAFSRARRSYWIRPAHEAEVRAVNGQAVPDTRFYVAVRARPSEQVVFWAPDIGDASDTPEDLAQFWFEHFHKYKVSGWEGRAGLLPEGTGR
jgi:hypothetical protein